MLHGIFSIHQGKRNPALTQVFCTNHAQKLPKIHFHAKFTQSRWMPDYSITQKRNFYYPIPVFTIWNMSNNALTLSTWGALKLTWRMEQIFQTKFNCLFILVTWVKNFLEYIFYIFRIQNAFADKIYRERCKGGKIWK